MSFLVQFFKSLIAHEVKYCILRNYQNLPFSTDGSDLDILIARKQHNLFIQILLETIKDHEGSIVSVIDSPSCPKYCLIVRKPGWWGMMVDVFLDEITYRESTLITSEHIWLNTESYNGLCVLNRKTDSLIVLLKEILSNKTCTEKQYNDFRQNSLDEVFLNNIFSTIGKKGTIPLLLGCFGKVYSDGEVQRLTLGLNKSFPDKWYSTGKKLTKITRVVRKPGYSICVLGTDGSGKSTIINELVMALNDTFHNAIYYHHLRPGFLNSLSRQFGNREIQTGPVMNPHGSEPSGFSGSIIRWSYYLIDYTIGYCIKVFPKKSTKACLFIFDRYYYDYYFDQHRSRINLPKWIIRFGQLLIPEPDIILCLGAVASIIHQRKPELPLQEVERQVNELKKFSEKHKKAVWIDTGKSIEKSTNDALEAIMGMMGKRFENVKLD